MTPRVQCNDQKQVPDILPAVLRVDNVAKKFGSFEAVKGISFSVAPGEVLGVLGPNGAGKSTLIRMMTALTPITYGDVYIDGFSVTQAPNEIRKRIGVLPQAMTSDTDLTVEENLIIYAKLYNLGASERRDKIDQLLEAVDLIPKRNAMVRTLSGGMRRRLEIARGLLHSPKVFFLDEPTTGLDPVSRVRVWELLKRFNIEYGITMIITTHYMDEADFLCNRIAIVDQGNLVALDTSQALKGSIPSGTLVDVKFNGVPESWEAELNHMPMIQQLSKVDDDCYMFRTEDESKMIAKLIELSVTANVGISNIAVKPTSLDDVFIHYTGRTIEEQKSAQDNGRRGARK